jgi:hypothetical protein
VSTRKIPVPLNLLVIVDEPARTIARAKRVVAVFATMEESVGGDEIAAAKDDILNMVYEALSYAEDTLRGMGISADGEEVQS